MSSLQEFWICFRSTVQLRRSLGTGTGQVEDLLGWDIANRYSIAFGKDLLMSLCMTTCVQHENGFDFVQIVRTIEHLY